MVALKLIRGGFPADGCLRVSLLVDLLALKRIRGGFPADGCLRVSLLVDLLALKRIRGGFPADGCGRVRYLGIGPSPRFLLTLSDLQEVIYFVEK